MVKTSVSALALIYDDAISFDWVWCLWRCLLCALDHPVGLFWQYFIMTIDNRCREQQPVADKMFMDFKYTSPGSPEQISSLKTLSFLIGMWNDFLEKEAKRMDAAMSLG